MTASRDPLLAAGVVVCNTCRCRTYPTDAAWLDEDRVLATFPAGCLHARGGTWVVTPSQLQPVTRTRCDAITKAGTWCRGRPVPGTPYCHAHRHQGAQHGNGGC